MIKIFLLFLVSGFCSAQNLFQTDFIATYDIEYPIQGKKNTEQFILFMNTKQDKSFYKSSNQYALDSLKNTGKISEGDFNSVFTYRTALNEDVFSDNNTFTVFKKIVDTKLKYTESNNLKWVILDDRREYLGYNTRKAYTFAYGRKWIAWFAEDLPINFGPYKFGNLPGLIINMYDEKAEYYLTLTLFKRKVKKILLPNQKQYKEVPKEKIKNAEYNTYLNLTSNIRIYDSDKEKREAVENLNKRIKQQPYLDLGLKPL